MRILAAALAIVLTLGGCQTLGNWRGAPAEAVPPGPDQVALGSHLTVGQSRQLLLEMVGGLQAQNLHKAALAYLDDYDRKHPGDESAQLLRAKSLSALGMSREAETVYWGLIKTRHAPAAYNGLGIVAAREGRWRAAEQEFRRAVELKPTNPGYLNNLGHAQMRLGQLAEADFTLSQALELKAGDFTARANLVLCAHLAGRRDEARRRLAALPETERTKVGAYVADYLREAAAVAGGRTGAEAGG